MENSSKYINSKSFCSSKCINFAHFASSFIDSLFTAFCTILYLFLYLMLSEFFMANLTVFQHRWGMSSKFSSNFSLNLRNGKMFVLCDWINSWIYEIWWSCKILIYFYFLFITASALHSSLLCFKTRLITWLSSLNSRLRDLMLILKLIMSLHYLLHSSSINMFNQWILLSF